MVCYARPLSFLAAIVIIAWMAFSGPVTHFFATAAILAAALVRGGRRGGGRGPRAHRRDVHPPSPVGRRWLRELPVPLPACDDRAAPVLAGHHRRPPGTRRGARRPPGRSGRPGSSPARSVPVLLPCLRCAPGSAGFRRAGRTGRGTGRAGSGPGGPRRPAWSRRSRSRQDGIGGLFRARGFGVLEQAPASAAGPFGLVHGVVGVGEQGRQVPAGPGVGDPGADRERDRPAVGAGDAGRADRSAGPRSGSPAGW